MKIHLVSKKIAIEAAVVVLALIGLRILFDVTSAAVYVRPEWNYGISGIAFFLFAIALLLVFTLGIVRFLQGRLAEGLLLLALLIVPFLFGEFINREHWKFQIHKKEYLATIQKLSATPKYLVFNWGNENLSFGGGFAAKAVVFDEADEIAKPFADRSKEWIERNVIQASPEDRWIYASLKNTRLVECR